MKYKKYNKILYHYNEKEIKELLLFHKVVKADVKTRTLTLDNGTELTFEGNEGCPGCISGWYYIEELSECDNVITNVEFVIDDDVKYKDYDNISYKIFVFAEDKRIKIAQIDGTDGNGYYGTGYAVYVKLKNNNN